MKSVNHLNLGFSTSTLEVSFIQLWKFGNHKYYHFLLLVIFCLFNSFTIVGQTKFEKEYRLKKEEVPQSAIAFLEPLPFTKKIKWYKEISQNGTSIEAKTKHQGHCHSIEFDAAGTVQDIEIKVRWAKIPVATRKQIKAQLTKQFQRYKIKKVQIQYTGPTADLQQIMQNQSIPPNITTRYEMIITGKSDKVKQYEFLFDETGIQLEKLVIELRNTDNLEY